MKLTELMKNVAVLEPVKLPEREITGLQFDSRNISPSEVFFAVRGTNTDGHRFISNAIENGAIVVVHDQPVETIKNVIFLQVEDAAEALGVAAANFFNNPSESLKLVGVTGTNGKTTVVTLLHQLFLEMGYRAGMLSTVENRVGETVVPATHTTPDPISLNRLLAEMVEASCDFCFMEVSSHAVVQHRVTGLHFSGGVFTNITHDHLDYHGTFANYINAKRTFFDRLDKSAFALSNADDKNGMIMLQNSRAYKKTYGLKRIADFKGRVLESHFNGMLMQIDEKEVWVKLVGGFNAYNILAVYGASLLLEQDSQKVLRALSKVHSAEGRFETWVSPDGKVGIVDYAHTPDALENILSTIRSLRGASEHQIITVVGCGGDRDKSKRPQMASVAVDYSDRVIFTSDNPRTEDPMQILSDMESGVPASLKRKYFTISDRREAIRAACHIAHPKDIILVAGKGHETYQEIGGVKHPFDDKDILIESLNES